MRIRFSFVQKIGKHFRMFSFQNEFVGIYILAEFDAHATQVGQLLFEKKAAFSGFHDPVVSKTKGNQKRSPLIKYTQWIPYRVHSIVIYIESIFYKKGKMVGYIPNGSCMHWFISDAPNPNPNRRAKMNDTARIRWIRGWTFSAFIIVTKSIDIDLWMK